jgi:tRNA A-37 threonylcarbamoyl transferase component Bud32
MGSVFEGNHVALSKPVAIKVLHEHIAHNEAMRARFLREARLAATLEHPHVVNILDVGVEGDVAYLVMELLTGQDLAGYLRSTPKLALEAALALFFPVASALAFAHAHGIVHRDLKPANVFIARDHHGELLPKIVDFGLSKLVTAEDALTESNVVMGTLEYMAPEQTFGTSKAGARSDQYTLAAILYEMVTAQLPFRRGDPRALVDAIRYAPVVVPSSLDPSLPSGFDDAVVRAMSRNPDDRFPDVLTFARRLLPFADTRTLRAWERDFARPTEPEEDSTLRALDTEGPSDTLVGIPPPAPRLPCDPGSSVYHIRGIAYRGVVQYVEQRVPGGMATLDEELEDARLSAFIRLPFLAASRYDILPMLPINVGIARILGKTLEAVCAEQGVAQARHDIRYVYRRAFEEMTFATVQSFLGRFANQYYEAGECTADLVSPGHIVVHRRKLPAYVLPWFLAIHVPYVEETLRLKGARTVSSTPRTPVEAGTRKGVVVVDVDVDVKWQ